MRIFSTAMRALFTRPSKPAPQPRGFNFHKHGQSWGWSLVIGNIDGLYIGFHGWGNGLRAGDYLVIPGAKGNPAPYRLTEIRYCTDPTDMFFGRAIYMSGAVMRRFEDTGLISINGVECPAHGRR